jgi:hypothetical protein
MRLKAHTKGPPEDSRKVRPEAAHHPPLASGRAQRMINLAKTQSALNPTLLRVLRVLKAARLRMHKKGPPGMREDGDPSRLRLPYPTLTAPEHGVPARRVAPERGEAPASAPTPPVTTHGLYRLTDRGITAAEEGWPYPATGAQEGTRRPWLPGVFGSS